MYAHVYLPYSQAKNILVDGDILLFQAKGPIGHLISKLGRGLHSHAAMVFWTSEPGKSDLMIVEFREFVGYNEQPLLEVVEEYGGKIDVFRPSPSFTELIYHDGRIISKTSYFDRKKTVDVMTHWKGLPYGWKRLFLMGRRHFYFIRFLFKDRIDDSAENGHVFPVCSTAIATALRKSYVDVIPFKPDIYVEPSDLARTPILNYLFTINGVGDEKI